MPRHPKVALANWLQTRDDLVQLLADYETRGQGRVEPANAARRSINALNEVIDYYLSAR